MLLRSGVLLIFSLLLVVPASPGLGATDPEKSFRDFVRDVWSLEEGLPQISVLSVQQGPDGYIWAGTQQGLARFDGVRFRVYRADEETGLPGSRIHALLRDDADRLWVGTYKGVAVREDGRFRSLEVAGDDEQQSPEIRVDTLAQTPRGEILVGADEGLFRVTDEALEPVSLSQSGTDRSEPVHALHARENDVLIGGLGHLYVWREGAVRESFALPGERDAVQVSAIAEHDGRLWVGTSEGLLYGHGPDALDAFTEHDHPGQPINVLYQDAAETLWAGTDASLLRLRSGRLREEIDDEHPNTHRQVESITEDHEGSLWLGSFREGLARYWSGHIQRYGRDQGLHESLVWSVADAGEGPDTADHDDLWVGTNDGLTRLSDGDYETVLSGDELPHPHAYTLLAEDDRVWVGTRRGLVITDADGDSPRTPEGMERLASLQINGIVPHEDRYLMATSGGLFSWHEGEGELESLAPEVGDRMVRQVRFDGEGLLVATESGAYYGSVADPQPLDSDPGLDGGRDFTAAHYLGDGLYLLASIDRGLHLGRPGEGWRTLSEEQGLPSNSAYSLAEDAQGDLWIGGFHGLYRVPLAQLHAYRRGERDAVDADMLLSESGEHFGAQQAECCNGAGHAKRLLRDDGLWLPTRKGTVRLRPERVERNSREPRILVEAVHHGGESREAVDGTMEVPAEDRDLQFDFTALSFRDPRSVRFRYRLVGFDDEWQSLPSGDRRSASWTNLPPGTYRFEVIGSNNAGVWAENPAVQEIRVRPYFHETFWFNALVALVLLGLVMAAFRWRVRAIRERQAELEAEVRTRTEELRIANERLRDASHTDPLTGLYNRRYLYDQMSRDLAHFERLRERLPERDPVMVFALVDVDHFKAVNDELGHRAGDDILVELARRLRNAVREGDYVVRWGGEEFLLVLREMERGETSGLIDRLQRRISDPPYGIGHQRTRRVHCSVGYAEYPVTAAGNGPGWEAVVELADRALYEVKRNGRDGWAVLRPGPGMEGPELPRRVREGFAEALESGEVILEASWQERD